MLACMSETRKPEERALVRPIAISAVLDMVAAMRIRHETLGPLRRPFNRAAHLGGSPCHDGFFGVMIDFGTETTANVGSDDPQFMLGVVQHEGAHQ